MRDKDLTKKVKKYEKSECRVKSDLFLELIDLSGGDMGFNKKELDCYNQLRNCGQPYFRKILDDPKQYFIKCHNPLCHKCNDYDRFEEGQKVLDKIKALFPRGKIVRSSVSWITINLSKLELGSDLLCETSEFKDIIMELLKRELPEVAMLGHFHVATQKAEHLDDPNAMPHYHALVVHKKNSMEEVAFRIKQKFPNKNAVRIECLDEDQDVEDSILILAAYAYNITFKYHGYGEETGTVLSKYLMSVESFRSGGRNGLRFEPGYRRVKNQFKQEQADERNRLIARLRRMRSKENENSTTNDFPKDSCIHKGLPDGVIIEEGVIQSGAAEYQSEPDSRRSSIISHIVERSIAFLKRVSQAISSFFREPSKAILKRE